MITLWNLTKICYYTKSNIIYDSTKFYSIPLDYYKVIAFRIFAHILEENMKNYTNWIPNAVCKNLDIVLIVRIALKFHWIC